MMDLRSEWLQLVGFQIHVFEKNISCQVVDRIKKMKMSVTTQNCLPCQITCVGPKYTVNCFKSLLLRKKTNH